MLTAGCGGQQNALAPKSHQSTDIASLFWWMTGISWVGARAVVLLMLVAWRRAKRRRTHGPKEGEELGFRVVVGAGVVFPIVADRGALRDLGHLRHQDDAGAGGDATTA